MGKKTTGDKRKRSDPEPVHIKPKRAKRQQTKPDHLLKRLSAIHRDEFFEQFTHERNGERISDDSIGSQHSNSSSTSNSMPTNTQSVPNNESTSNDESVLRIPNSSDETLRDSNNGSRQSNNAVDDASDSSSIKNNFESAVLSKLDEILKRIEYLEKDSCKTQARLNKLERSLEQYFDRLNGDGIDAVETVSESDREKFGIPISSKTGLDKLEKDLSDLDHKAKLVIIIEIFLSKISDTDFCVRVFQHNTQ